MHNRLYKSFIKRGADIFFSLAALLSLSPLFGVISLIILVSDGRPVLFTQERPGKGGRIFRIVKFRTMRNLSGENTLTDRERLTATGKVLRKTSLDELPQFVNVLRGEMSFVGPRPLLKEYLPYYSGRQGIRHAIRPGMTGLAQVKGRNSIDWATKFHYDIYYVDNLSVWLDIKICFLTVANIFRFRDNRTEPVKKFMEEYYEYIDSKQTIARVP